ncbi:MAG: glycosyltransferase [Planctomycetes bacterium]|nr:glycosyltransferase [Planctomycetota bacterium]
MPLPPDSRPHEAAVSVVIPTWNGNDRLHGCLASLIDPSIRAVIVVDNGSAPPLSLDDLSRHASSPVEIVRLRDNRGFAAGCNAGIARARTPYVAVFNDDAHSGPRTFTHLVGCLRRQPRAGFAAPRSNQVRGRQLWRAPAPAHAALEIDYTDTAAIETRLTEQHAGRCEDTELLSGLCLVAHRDTWVRLGGFDEEFGLGNYEDDDLSLRVRLDGRRLLIAHDAYVWHEGNATFRALSIDYREQLGAQRELFEQRWRDTPLALAELASFDGDQDVVMQLAPRLHECDAIERAWAAAPLARALATLGRDDAAALEWERVLRVAPLHREAWCSIALHALTKRRDEEAAAMFTHIETVLPMDATTHAKVLTHRARIHAERSDALLGTSQQHAHALLQRALLHVPGYRPAIELRAALLLASNNVPEARALLELLSDSNNADVLANLGIARFLTGDMRGARDALRAGAMLGGPDSIAAKNFALVS